MDVLPEVLTALKLCTPPPGENQQATLWFLWYETRNKPNKPNKPKTPPRVLPSAGHLVTLP
jgi:hypothetical protein